jgi:hypothetical protein
MFKKIYTKLSKIWHLKSIQIFIPSKVYLKIQYKNKMRKRMDFKNVRTFNEKIQWLKLYNRNPLYTQLVDKYVVRKYIAKTIGDEYLIPLIGVWDKFEDIDFSQLLDQFVLKCTHDSGGVVICKDKKNLNIEEVRKKINSSLKTNYYYACREWPYKNVKPRIICEKYMIDESNTELKDYKFHCFQGKPKLIQVDFGRFTNHRRNLFDINWNYIEASILYPNDPDEIIERPVNLERMLEIASILSKSFPYVRVDLYSIKSKIYFGELTFYHGAGYEKFRPSELEMQMGDWIKLPLKCNEQ